MTWLRGGSKPADRASAQIALEAPKQADSHAEVPVTWSLEVSNVIARAEAKGLLAEAQSEAFLEMLSSAPIRADGATFARALDSTLNLARRYRLSAYDASYLEISLRRMPGPSSTPTESRRLAAACPAATLRPFAALFCFATVQSVS